MKKLTILREELSFTDSLIRIGDIMNFEGPLLVLFEDIRNGRLYLFDWVDRNSKGNRWIIYRVMPQALNKFINKEISQLELFKSNLNNKYFYTNIARNEKLNDCRIFEIENLPINYLPKENNYFEVSESKSFNKIQFTILRILSRQKQDNCISTLDNIHFISRKLRTNKIEKSYSFSVSKVGKLTDTLLDQTVPFQKIKRDFNYVSITFSRSDAKYHKLNKIYA